MNWLAQDLDASQSGEANGTVCSLAYFIPVHPLTIDTGRIRRRTPCTDLARRKLRDPRCRIGQEECAGDFPHSAPGFQRETKARTFSDKREHLSEIKCHRFAFRQ